MRRIIFLLFLIPAIALSARTYTPEEVPDVQLGDVRQFVSNPDGVLSAATVEALNTRLDSLRASGIAELYVVAIDRFAGAPDIMSYATKIFDLWHPGSKETNNGIIYVVASGDRQAAIATGSGVGAALTDVACYRIIDDFAAPLYKKGDYNQGTLAAVDAIVTAVTDPAFAEELRAPIEGEDGEWFMSYVWICIIVTIIMALMVCFDVYKYRKLPPEARWLRLRSPASGIGWCSFFFLGFPVVVYLPLKLFLRHLREHTRNCPNCGAEMERLGEEEDNEHLTPAQDLEEQLRSVDYDVWLCPDCGTTEILAFPERDTPYIECPQCHSRTAILKGQRIVQQPTTRAEGHGVMEYGCKLCGHTWGKPFTIPKKVDGSALAAAAAIGAAAGMAGRRGGGGGGSFGGFHGGGRTSGGGGHGSW